MATLERTAERRNTPPQVNRVAWGAIIGGTTIAIAIVVVLETLGIAVGATTIDVGPGDSPSATALGTGAAIWWLVSGVLGLFAGGWVAARLAGVGRRMEGPLHGLISWGLTAIATMAVMSTLMAMLISGAFRVVGSTAMATEAGTRAVVQRVVSSNLEPDVAWDEVWQEAQSILRQTKSKALRPEKLGQELEAVAEDIRRADLESALSRLSRSARRVASATDRAAAVNVLIARTGMAEEDARATVDRWANKLEDAWDTSAATAAEVPHVATVAAKKTLHAASATAWWTFFYLFLTAGAAALGGYFGAPKRRGSSQFSSQAGEGVHVSVGSTSASPESQG